MHESMREKVLFNFLTVPGEKREKKKKQEQNLTTFPNNLPKAAHVKLIISIKKENEVHCKIIKVRDIMFLHTATCLAPLKIT